MDANIARYEEDFRKLLDLAFDLHNAIQFECNPDEFIRLVEEKNKDPEKVKNIINELPKFKTVYQKWYSESKSLIKNLLPDRYDDFRKYYETPKSRKNISYENYVIEDYMLGLKMTRNFDGKVIVDPSAAIPKYRQQIAIFESLANRFRSSLFDIRALMQADLFDSELDAAKELLRHKFFRASGALIGVVLEKHLKDVCSNHKLSLAKKSPVISDYNEALKTSDVVDVPTWRFIQHLADIRNLCDHSKENEPSSEQINDFIIGVDKIIKTVF